MTMGYGKLRLGIRTSKIGVVNYRAKYGVIVGKSIGKRVLEAEPRLERR